MNAACDGDVEACAGGRESYLGSGGGGGGAKTCFV